MNETAEKEPTMEEILASIRRIISEDGPAEGGSETPADAEDAMADAEPAAVEDGTDASTGAADEGDDILELTEPAEDGEGAHAEPEPEPEPVFEEPEPEAESEPEDGVDAGSPEEQQSDALDDDRIVSEEAEQLAGASFAELSAMLVGGYDGANTLEGLVREMLKPMLKSWLDENLPRIVEDMVEREVARIAARRGRK